MNKLEAARLSKVIVMDKNIDIVNLVLQKCIELFEQEQKADFPQDGINYGTPPKAALIAYGLGKMKKVAYQITDIQRKWSYEYGCLKETDIRREIDRKQRNGIYYLEASFEFALDTDNHWVYLNIYYGPRYARGIKFELEQEENRVVLCNEKVLWVS